MKFDSLPQYRNIYREIANPDMPPISKQSNPKSTSYYNDVKFLRGVQENCEPNELDCF